MLIGYHMAITNGLTLAQKYLVRQATLPASVSFYDNGTKETPMTEPFFPMATMVYFEFMFVAITAILFAGSLLGHMNFRPIWPLAFLLLHYTFNIWGGGFLCHTSVIDYSDVYVIHVSSDIEGFV